MKRLVIILLFGALGACLIPAAAQSADWQSTSTLPASGSAYSSQVTAVGATTVQGQATTAGSSPLRVGRGPRKDNDFPDIKEGGVGDEGSPVGDAVLPLLLMAAAGGVAVAVRRRRSTRVAGE